MAKTDASTHKGMEAIVRECGAYAPEAFDFVSEGLTIASYRVHGPRSRQEQKIVRWMNKASLTYEDLQRMYEDESLPPNVRAAVDKAGGIEALDRHVTGQQLCMGLRDLALERWGHLARTVLAHYGITSTMDFGRIVFAMVDNQKLSKKPTDTIHDFDRVYDFKEAFDRSYRIQLDAAPQRGRSASTG